MAGEKFTRKEFKEQQTLRCSLRRDVTSTLAQTKKLVYDSLKKKTEVELSAGHILHQSTDATSMTQVQPSHALTQKGTPLKVNTIIAQKKNQRQRS
jgi:hypothetical protein